MEKEKLFSLKEKLSHLTEQEVLERDLELRKIHLGEKDGELTGYASIDKPWLKYYTPEQIETPMPSMSAYSYLYQQNKDHKANIALSYFGRNITFDEVFSKIDDTARALKQLGVKENEIVTISLPNIPEGVYLFYAISKIGAVANMIDPRTSPNGIRNYVEEVKSDKVFIIDSFYYKVKPLLSDGTVNKIIAVSPSESLPLGLRVGYKVKSFIDSKKDPDLRVEFDSKTIDWKTFINEGKNNTDSLEVDYIPNRPLVIEHTGGTTGNPKGVVLTNENINAVALQSVLTGIDMQREHTWLDIMPTFIAYGVGMGLHLPLTIGMKTYLIPQFDAEKFDDLLVKYKPVHMIGVPSYWGTIVSSKKLAKKDLSYMIAPTVGGDSMNITLEQQANQFLKEHNCTSKIVKGYGMTEVTGGVSGTVDENNELGSVGIPFVKTTIAIFDPGTEDELGYNQDGEVCITGPNNMLEYFNNRVATDGIMKRHSDGKIWVHSGDIGHMTKDGSLYIVDRMKRMIIRYDGFKVFPSIIENVLNSHRAIKMCKVVSICDAEHSQGRLPKAHIVLKEEFVPYESQILDELKQLCMDKLPEYVQPVDYVFRKDLPLTPIGKVDYLALEAEDIDIQNLGSSRVLKRTK